MSQIVSGDNKVTVETTPKKISAGEAVSNFLATATNDFTNRRYGSNETSSVTGGQFTGQSLLSSPVALGIGAATLLALAWIVTRVPKKRNPAKKSAKHPVLVHQYYRSKRSKGKKIKGLVGKKTNKYHYLKDGTKVYY